MALRSTLVTSLALALFLAGCAGERGGPGDGDGSDPGDDGGDLVAGQYEVTSTYDLSQSPLVPELIGDALAPLTGLSEDPAGTLIDVLSSTDSAALNDLLDAIPDSLVDLFADAVNDYLLDALYDGVPVTEEIVAWTDDIASMLTHFEVMTTLGVQPLDAVGNTAASHALAAVAFQLRGDRRLVDTPELLDTLTVARGVSCNVELGAGRIDIGDHAFHLPLGDFTVVALNQALQAELGVSDLRELLSTRIDCAGLAANVADKCLGPVCVGHEAEIETFCEAGIDAVVDRVEARLAAIDFAELHLAGGTATLHDGGKSDGVVDALVDRMDGGTWQADVNVDGTVVPVPATFVAERVVADRGDGPQ